MGAKLRDILRYDRAVPFPRPTRERAADALADAGEGRSDEEFLEIPLTFILSRQILHRAIRNRCAEAMFC